MIILLLILFAAAMILAVYTFIYSLICSLMIIVDSGFDRSIVCDCNRGEYVLPLNLNPFFAYRVKVVQEDGENYREVLPLKLKIMVASKKSVVEVHDIEEVSFRHTGSVSNISDLCDLNIPFFKKFSYLELKIIVAPDKDFCSDVIFTVKVERTSFQK